MKKTLIMLSVIALLATACKQATKQQQTEEQPLTEQSSELQTPEIESADIEADLPARIVKHLFRADGNNYICFDDGTAFEETEDKPDTYDYLIHSGKINPEKPGNIETNATYREFPTYLTFSGNKHKWKFFNNWGHIEWGWQIIHYYRIYSRLQITNFEPATAKISTKEIQEIEETCLIFFAPKENYEEWVWYMDDRKTEYAEMGIPSVDAQKRYLSFTLYDTEKITIDTAKKQNGITYSALLYRKGYIPIMICISGSSEDEMELIESYLSESGDGYPPFESWNTLKEKISK